MSVLTWAAARAGKLPRAITTDVVVERDLEVKMADGAVLLADRWYSPETVHSAPVILIRSPYGRRQISIFGRLFGERGYQVVIQSCRGTFGSKGELEPFHHEREDGQTTLEWIAGEPWFTGSVGMFGPSYLGLVQWAVASDPPDYLRAMAMQVTAANVRDAVVFPGGSFSLETGAFWVQQMVYQESTLRYLWAVATSKRRLDPVYRELPLRDADLRAHGFRVGYYQDWLDHAEPGDRWWDGFDYSRRLEAVPPTSHVAGWFDLFLPSQIQDFCRLRQAGRESRITIGPWTHVSIGGGGASIRDGLDFFDRQLRGRRGGGDRAPVRIYVMGSDRWVDLPDWPPPAEGQSWYLHGGGALGPARPAAGGPDRYRYDPADPTPSLSGPTLDPFHAGSKNQAKRESRSDVLVYSSPVLDKDVTVAGPVKADVWVRSTRPHFDVFVRLCDVDARGRSFNVCDGIKRIHPGLDGVATDAAGVQRVQVDMWPTAQTFRAGHRIRLQVSSAAHPLFARNTGSGEPLGDAVKTFPSDHEIFRDPDHPSAIDLPVSPI